MNSGEASYLYTNTLFLRSITEMKIQVEIVETIDVGTAYKRLSNPRSGAICVFFGSVRETTQNEEVVALDFEAYEKMALLEMQKISKKAFEKWALNQVLVSHVIGKKKVEEPVVMVGVSAAHRSEAFEACRFLIDTLKSNVPIWKKEIFKNKSVWVSSHP